MLASGMDTQEGPGGRLAAWDSEPPPSLADPAAWPPMISGNDVSGLPAPLPAEGPPAWPARLLTHAGIPALVVAGVTLETIITLGNDAFGLNLQHMERASHPLYLAASLLLLICSAAVPAWLEARVPRGPRTGFAVVSAYLGAVLLDNVALHWPASQFDDLNAFLAISTLLLIGAALILVAWAVQRWLAPESSRAATAAPPPGIRHPPGEEAERLPWLTR